LRRVDGKPAPGSEQLVADTAFADRDSRAR
jgi:hypothetical protein